jgi:hypothetical protein
VDDVDGHVERGVALELVVAAEVDDRADAVVDERLPAGIGQVPDAVRPDDRAELGRPSVLRDVSAQVADVEAPLPAEDALGQEPSSLRSTNWRMPPWRT